MNKPLKSTQSLKREDGVVEYPGADTKTTQEILVPALTFSDNDGGVLYHLGLSKEANNLPEMFGDVKFICMGGTRRRAEQFAQLLKEDLKTVFEDESTKTTLMDMSEKGGRYSIFKVGPVLSVSHGMGMPSIGILLHELLKLVKLAEMKDPKFIRIGTCGGLGVEAGTIILTETIVDPLGQSTYDVPILGKIVKRPAKFKGKLLEEIKLFAKKNCLTNELTSGKTMCTSDFYEGQGRRDGAFCEFSEEEKMAYLKELKSKDIKNIEMESLAFAALTYHAGMDAAVVCVSIIDRLNGDQILSPKEVLDEWQQRPLKLVTKFIKKLLEKPIEPQILPI